MTQPQPCKLSLAQRAAALLCLAAMLMALPGVVPAAVAVVAYCEGSHQVIFHEDGAATEVVLHHEGNGDCGRGLHHQHCLTARLVVLFADPASREADHVLKFTAGHSALKSDTVAWAEPDDAPSNPPVIATEHFTLQISPATLLPSEHAPPAIAASLISLRTTVLVI